MDVLNKIEVQHYYNTDYIIKTLLIAKQAAETYFQENKRVAFKNARLYDMMDAALQNINHALEKFKPCE